MYNSYAMCPLCMHGGWRTTRRSQFSSFTLEVPGITQRSPDLAASSALALWVISLSPFLLNFISASQCVQIQYPHATLKLPTNPNPTRKIVCLSRQSHGIVYYYSDKISLGSDNYPFKSCLHRIRCRLLSCLINCAFEIASWKDIGVSWCYLNSFSIDVIKIMSKKTLGMKGCIWLTLQAVVRGSQGHREPCLLADSSCLAQIVSLEHSEPQTRGWYCPPTSPINQEYILQTCW